MNKADQLSIRQRGALLQDAYWYAERAAGGEDIWGGAYSRSRALRLALRAACRAGLRLSSAGKRIEHGRAIVWTIEAFAATYGIDARTGEPARCEQCDRSLTAHDHDGCYWTRETERGRVAVAAVLSQVPAWKRA